MLGRRPRPTRNRSEVILPLESRRLLSAAVSPSAAPAPLSTLPNILVSHNPQPLLRRLPGVAAAMTGRLAPAKPAPATPAASPASEALESSDAATASPNPAPGSLPAAPLAGRVVYTHGGHGYVWRDTSNGYWGVMRSYLHGMMEDMGNQDQLQPFAEYLLRSGATVVSMRPVGSQHNEVIVDNSNAYSAANGGFQTLSGTWTAQTATPYWSNNNGDDPVRYVGAATSLTETAVSRFTPRINSPGFYPVYAWYNPGTNGSSNNRAADQTFRINYSGGSHEVKVAANKTGKGWVYLGNYYFDAGVNPASGSVDVSNKSATTGKLAIADAIRFGNGMGDVNYSFTYSSGVETVKNFPVSGQAREDEAALYWVYASRGWNGANNRVAGSVAYGGSLLNDEQKNFSAPTAYAAYMNQGSVGSNRDRLWISFHTNAAGGRGTVGLITGSATANQEDLALLAGRTVQNVMQGLDASHEHAWVMNPNPVFEGAYGEISTSSIGSEFDATIIEVAFHDNATDAALIKDPAVRLNVGKASYHTVVQYFKLFGSLATTTYLPEPPADVRATTDPAGNVTVSWNPGPSSPVLAGYNPLGADNVNSTADNPGPYGNPAVGYKVYTSTNGYGFDGGVTVTGATSLTFPSLSATSPTYFRVTAYNAGGESLGSYVVVAKPQASGRAPILIVNGFTRVDDDGDQIQTKYFGTAARARFRYNNTFDYVVQAARSVNAYNPALGVESAPASAVAAGLVNLAEYQAVIWLAGEQATARFNTFDPTTQSLLTNYLDAGGKLFLSGSNVAYNLASTGENKGDTFLSSTLRTAYVRNDTNTYNFSAGLPGSAFANVPAGSFSNGTQGTYDVDQPDGFSTANSSTAALNYSGGTGGTAATQYASGNTRLIVLGFPLESVFSDPTRNALVAGALNFFGLPATGLPASTPAPGTPDLLATSDLGPFDDDNVTNQNNSPTRTLQFLIPNTLPGALVQLYAGATLIASATATTTSTLLTTNGTATLPNATYSLFATQTAPETGTSPISPSLPITIDATAPTVTLPPVTYPRSSSLPSLSATFSEFIYGLDRADFLLTRDTSPIAYTPSQSLTTTSNVHTLTNLTALTTNPGAYSLSLDPATSGITDLAGNPLAAGASANWVMNTILATPGNDLVLLSRDPVTPSTLTVLVNNNPTYTLNLSTLGNLLLHTDAGDDVIALDFSAGHPHFNPGSSLSLNTGTAITRDSVILIGTPGDDNVAVTSSTLYFNTASPISYSTTAPTTVNFSFRGTTGNDAVYALYASLSFPTDASLDTPNLTLNLGTGASATFASTQHLAALNLSDNATATLTQGGNKSLITNSLTLNDTSTLDLTNNALILHTPGTPDAHPNLLSIRQYLHSRKLFSSTAQSNPAQNTTLGYATASDLSLSTFSTHPLTPTSLLIKYTYHNDTNLDGRLTPDDLARTDRGLLFNHSTWLHGDSNHDGIIDATDLARAHHAFATQTTIL